MKKVIFFLAAVLLMASCVKQTPKDDQPVDIWNGYSKYFNLKSTDSVRTLWAGQFIDAGTVTYGFREVDGIGYFYTKYDCSATEWLLTETHLYCGNFDTMPVNIKKNGTILPKIGRFPYQGVHSPTDVVEYYVPISTLPCAGQEICPTGPWGFTVAAHCVVVTNTGGNETAWAFGPKHFHDKEWGWYDEYEYDNTIGNRDPVDIAYGIDTRNDTLKVYRIDLTKGTTEEIYSEPISGSSSFDGVALNETEGKLYFADMTTGDLYTLDLTDNTFMQYTGTLVGTPSGGTYYDGEYYYVDSATNIIRRVSFNVDGTIAANVEVATIPYAVTVNDIAMSPAGVLYIAGVSSTDVVSLIKYENGTFTTRDYPELNPTVQISFVGTDLYAVQDDANSTGWISYKIDLTTGDGTEDNGDIGGPRSTDIAGARY